MQKVRDVLSRWERGELSILGAGELLGVGIEHSPAYSPEARGRSERMFGTVQSLPPAKAGDRLIMELA